MRKNVLILLLLSFCSLWAQDSSSKLLFGSTAQPLSPKRGYVRTMDGLLYDSEIGLTKNLSFGAGTTFYTLFGNRDLYRMRGLSLKGKMAFPIGENRYIGWSGLYFFRFGEYSNNPEHFFLNTALFTADLEVLQATFGLGFSNRYDIAEPEKQWVPLTTFGLNVPVYRNFSLVGEAWGVFFKSYYTDRGYSYFSAVALRWCPRRFALELGPSLVVGDDGDGRFDVWFPWAGLSWFW